MHVASRVASRAASARVQGCSIHITTAVLLYFVEKCSLYYLSVEICVATIRNLQPLDAEKHFINMGMAPHTISGTTVCD